MAGPGGGRRQGDHRLPRVAAESRPHLRCRGCRGRKAANAAREKTTTRFAELLEPGRRLREVDPGVEEGLIGGLVTLLGRRVLNGEADQLEALAPAVIEFVLSPYLGVDEARAVIARGSQ